MLQDRLWARETRERQASERTEREELARFCRQQQEQLEKQAKEATEALRNQQVEKQKCQEEWEREWQNGVNDESRTQQQHTRFNVLDGNHNQTHSLACRHDCWWPEVKSHTFCPVCHEAWAYLLQCPSCEMKACPRCQSTIRPRKRVINRLKTSSPDYYADYLE